GLSRAIRRADGRCSALHFGTYDYTAALGVAPRWQSMAHPAADHAKAVIALAAAAAGVWVSDGSTQVVPVGDDDAVRAAMTAHFALVNRSLERGLYQGWDMHPGHLVTRWAATLAFYNDALPAVAARVQAYVSGRAAGAAVDEPATAQMLAVMLLRGLECGAFTLEQIAEHAPQSGRDVLEALSVRQEVTL
ncbi:MAG: aldolase, partial [Gordonia sp. (in: high G+C Gram-positive bacteria)]